jgi:predicted oxidoreductase
MAWSPLGGGKLLDDIEEVKNKRILAAAQFLADKYCVNFDQVLLAFLFNHPAKIIPVLGSTKINRLIKALEAADLKLEREEWFMLWRASMGHEVA